MGKWEISGKFVSWWEFRGKMFLKLKLLLIHYYMNIQQRATQDDPTAVYRFV